MAANKILSKSNAGDPIAPSVGFKEPSKPLNPANRGLAAY